MRYITQERAALLLILLVAECIPPDAGAGGPGGPGSVPTKLPSDYEFQKEVIRMYYKTCPNCGAHLDPGEACDCSEKEKGRPVREAPDGHGEIDMGYVSMSILEKTGEVVKD